MNETYAQLLAGFASATTFDALPADVVASVRRRVLDIVGVSLAALPLATSASAIDVARMQGGAEQARAIGVERPMPAPLAAFVNGVLAHSLDYDDTHLPSVLHPSAPVIPAALAAAELAGASGPETVAAIAVGLEICVRLGMAGYDRYARASLYFNRGQHATSICGAIAGAAAASKLLGLGPGGIADAIGVAVSMGAGVIEGNRAGGTVKRLHCGIAAQSAVTAAQLARAGFTGPSTSLEGRFGLFQAFLGGHYNADALTDRLGEFWDVPSIFFKPYPCNHFTHSAIDAAIALRARGVAPEDIDSLTLGVAGATVRTIGEPLAVKRAPETGYQAAFSGPYAVAAGMFGGTGLGVGLDDFTDELARDPARRALMARVTVVADKECDAIFPDRFPAVLTAVTRDGATFVERVMTNRGGPERPLSDDELAAKFHDNAARVLDDEAIGMIRGSVARMERLDDIGALLAPTKHAKKE